jgi:hypothetical protein
VWLSFASDRKVLRRRGGAAARPPSAAVIPSDGILPDLRTRRPSGCWLRGRRTRARGTAAWPIQQQPPVRAAAAASRSKPHT